MIDRTLKELTWLCGFISVVKILHAKKSCVFCKNEEKCFFPVLIMC